MNTKDIPQIKELTPKEFRSIAQSLTWMGYGTKETVLERLKLNTKADPEFLFNVFLESNLIKLNDEQYEPTILLSAIGGISFAKRKKSEDAWLEVAKIIARTVALSQSIDWCIETPSSLYIFGSMLDPNKKDHGDADLSLTTNRTEDYNILRKKQEEWLDNYHPFISKRFDSSYDFFDESQLKSDIKSSSNFPSIHYVSDILSLSELNKNFPVMNLWENEFFKSNPPKNDDEKKCQELCIEWRKNNPEDYKVAQEKLHKALKKLGISSTNKTKYISQCENYVKNTLKNDIVKKITNLSNDATVTNRAVRFCKVGFKAIDEAIEDIEEMENSSIEDTQLELFLAINLDIKISNKKMKY